MAKKNVPGLRFHYQKKTTLSDRTGLKKFILKAVRQYGFTIKDVQIIFCSDHYLLNINQLHLNHDFYTDIITFQYPEPHPLLCGELYISVDRVKENASGLGVSYSTELHRVIFHGLLHLLGYTDKSAKGEKQMRKEEDVWLKKYGLL